MLFMVHKIVLFEILRVWRVLHLSASFSKAFCKLSVLVYTSQQLMTMVVRQVPSSLCLLMSNDYCVVM